MKSLFARRAREGDDAPGEQSMGVVRDDPSDSGRPLVVFDHIPKTAGTTFRRSYLTAAFPGDQRWILSGGQKNAEDLERFLELPPERRRRIRIVAGHYADSLRVHVPGARFVTIIRDPVDRVVSSYLHALFHPGGDELWREVREKQMGLREFVLNCESPNTQSAQLLGEGDFTERGIRQTLQTRYALVGYTEAFDQFVFLMHVIEGFPLCLYNNRLVRRERANYAPSDDDLAFVRQLNGQDVRLHEVVRAEFQRSITELPSNTQAMMGRYLEALDRFRATTAGDPTKSLRLDDECGRNEEAASMFAFVFGRKPGGSRHPLPPA